jgi:hypothetical protein
MRPVHTGIHLHVPASFDASSIPALAGLHNEAHWLLHKVSWGRIRYRHENLANGDESKKEFVNVSRQTMERFIHPKDATDARDALVDAGVLICDGEFVQRQHDPLRRGKSLGYRIADAHLGPLRRVEIDKKSLARKVLASRVSFEGKPTPPEVIAGTVYGHLLDNLRRLKIDTEHAYEVIDEVAERRVRKLSQADRRRIITGYTAYLNRATADTIAHGDLEFEVCRFGRIHTNVTRLLTEARECLSIDGKPLVEIDVKNSQPVFLALLMMENAEPTPDIRRFVDLTMSGRLYDHLMSELGQIDRAAFKQSFFANVLYGDPWAWYARESQLTRLFQRQFPGVYKFIIDQKRGNYARLAQEMQRRESDLMILGACERLRREHPGIPIITIHDAALTTKEHVQTVGGIIEEEFQAIGITPRLSVKAAA